MKYLTRAMVLCAYLCTSSVWAQSENGASLIIGSNYGGGTIVSTGTLSLGGTITYGGTTGGSLILGGNSIGIISGTTLGGTLTPIVTVTGSVNLATFNSFTNTGYVIFNNPSYFTLNLDSPGTGTILSGDLTLNSPSLTFASSDPNAVLAPGTAFTLFTYQGTETGTMMYNGTPLPEGSLFNWNSNTFVIHYAVGDPAVEITVVPEPSPTLLFLLGATLLFVTIRIKGSRRASESRKLLQDWDV